MKDQQVPRSAEGSSVFVWQPMVYVAGPYTMGWRDSPLAVMRNEALGWRAVYDVVTACGGNVTAYPPWWDAKIVELDALFADGYCEPITCEQFANSSLNALLRCDGAVFTGDWTNSAGCGVEWKFCAEHDIPRLDATYRDLAEVAAWVQGLGSRMFVARRSCPQITAV